MSVKISVFRLLTSCCRYDIMVSDDGSQKRLPFIKCTDKRYQYTNAANDTNRCEFFQSLLCIIRNH